MKLVCSYICHLSQCDSHTNISEFTDWKCRYESKTNTSYIRTSGKARCYDCNRSGFEKILKSSSSENNNKTRRKVSVKINACCPARITVKVDQSDKLQVNHQTVHTGHDFDPKFIQNNKVSTAIIKELICDKTEVEHVPDVVRRKALTDNRLNIDKLKLLEYSDCYSQKHYHRIHLEERTHKDMWISACTLIASYSSSHVVCHTPVSHKDNFQLGLMNERQLGYLKLYGHRCICIDTTFNICSKALKLTVVVVLDDFE